MSCVLTTLTVVSALTAGVWSDTSVNTNIQQVAEQPMEVMSQVKFYTDPTTGEINKKIAVSKTLVCGDDIDAKTNSFLEVK